MNRIIEMISGEVNLGEMQDKIRHIEDKITVQVT